MLSWMIGLGLALLAVGVLAWLAVRLRGDRFSSLGDIRGQQVETVIRRLGQPTRKLDRPDGSELFWLDVASSRTSQLVISVDGFGRVIGWDHTRT